MTKYDLPHCQYVVWYMPDPIPLPVPALSALSFRSPLAALRRGGDHSRNSSGAVEDTGLNASLRTCGRFKCERDWVLAWPG